MKWSVLWPRLLNTALGIWLMAAPGILNYTGLTAETNDRIIGPIAAAIAIIAIWDPVRGLRLVNVPLGLWLIVAPAVLQYERTDIVLNSVLVGLVMALVAFVKGPIGQKFDGGWRMLFHRRDDRETIG